MASYEGNETNIRLEPEMLTQSQTTTTSVGLSHPNRHLVNA